MTVQGFINKYNKDYYGGALMLALGLGATFQGMTYQVGTLSHMGPGFFPTSLGAILAVIGAILIVTAKSSISEAEDVYQPPEWRGWICIVSSLVAFVVFGVYGGLLPATFAVVFISALGDRNNTVTQAFLLAVALTVVGVVVFWWALQMQFPLFRWG